MNTLALALLAQDFRILNFDFRFPQRSAPQGIVGPKSKFENRNSKIPSAGDASP
jgi:hypothetical protein